MLSRTRIRSTLRPLSFALKRRGTMRRTRNPFSSDHFFSLSPRDVCALQCMRFACRSAEKRTLNLNVMSCHSDSGLFGKRHNKIIMQTGLTGSFSSDFLIDQKVLTKSPKVSFERIENCILTNEPFSMFGFTLSQVFFVRSHDL